jgi:hypothetical protein
MDNQSDQAESSNHDQSDQEAETLGEGQEAESSKPDDRSGRDESSDSDGQSEEAETSGDDQSSSDDWWSS